MNNIDFVRALRLVFCATLACLGLLNAAPAGAEQLPDPTRPPATLRRGTVTLTPSGTAPEQPVLQSVMTGEGLTPSAIISGKLVQLGDTFNGLRLTQVNERGAVLTGPSGGTTLPLTPGSDKHLGAVAVPARIAIVPIAPTKPVVQTAGIRVAESQ
jgi:hypothetical protein